MELWKIIEKYILHTSVFVSVQPIFYIISTFVLFGLEIDWKLGLISILSAFFAYTVNKATDMKEDLVNDPIKYLFYETHGKKLYLLGAISYLIALYLSFQYNYLITIIVLIPFVLGIAYSIRWIPKSKYTRIKDIPGGKTLVLSFAWASVILLISYYTGFTHTLLSLFLYVFLIEFIAAMAFDVRDIKGDMKAGIKTMPVLFGKKNTFIILYSLNILALIFSLLIIYFGIFPFNMILTSIGMFIFLMISFRLMLTKINRAFIYDLFFESLTIFFLVFVVLGNIFL